MILIRLKGGLGNQMFQYAFGMQVARKLGTEMLLDTTSLLNRNKGEDFVYRDFDLSIFNIKAKHKMSHGLVKRISDWKVSRFTSYIGKRISRKLEHIKEPHFHVYDEYITKPTDNALYEGWFQSHKYYEKVEEELRKEFVFINALLPNSRVLANEIKDKNSICLNVRRTDFLQVDALNTTNLDYFLNAARIMENKVEKPHFYIFSDDVEWCLENIKVDAPMTVVDHTHKGHKFGNYLHLMSLCKHFIIPNSSFAYWAVWLSKSKSVIAPKKWFADPQYDTSDLQKEEWILL